MQRTKIVIASVLKLLKDPRAFYKMALSLRETNKYHINIIGFSTKKEIDEDYIKFTPIFYQKRNAFSRFSVGIRFLKELFQFRPEVVIVSTYELLPAAVFAKVFLKFKLVYDVQENYSLNLQHNHSLVGPKKRLAIHLVNSIENFAKSAIDLYIFAEACYRNELPKWKPYVILENKFTFPNPPNLKTDASYKLSKRFLITGTLTPAFGSLDGVKWFLNFNQKYPDSHLTILGHVPLENFKKDLLDIVENHSSINHNLSDLPIPYKEIIQAISASDILLLPYHQMPSIAPKIPSKLFEGCGLGKVIYHTPNSDWKNFVELNGKGMEIDFLSAANFENAYTFLNQTLAKTSQTPDEVYWKSIEQKFLEAINSLTAPTL